MSEEWKIVERRFYESLKGSSGYKRQSSLYNECSDLSDDDIVKLVNALSDRCDVVLVNGFYRYVEMTQEKFAQIIKMISNDLNDDYIDVSDIFITYRKELEQFDIRNPQELYAVIDKQLHVNPCAVSTRIRSKEILDKYRIYKEESSSAGNVSDTIGSGKSDDGEIRIEIDPRAILLPVYQNIKDIEVRYFRIVGKHIRIQDLCSILDRYAYSVWMFPKKYRICDISDSAITAIMEIATNRLNVKRAPIGNIYNEIKKECFTYDIHMESELNQILMKRVPGISTSISGEYDISRYLRKCDDLPSIDNVDNMSIIGDGEVVSEGTARSLGDEPIGPVFDTIREEVPVDDYVCYSVLRNRLIDKYDQNTIKQKLSDLVKWGMIFNTDAGYRRPKAYSRERLQEIMDRYHDGVYSSKKIFNDTKVDLNELDVRSSQELLSCICAVGRAHIVDNRLGLVSFDGINLDDFIISGYDSSEDKSNFPYVFEANTGIDAGTIMERLKQCHITIYQTPAIGDKKNLIPFSSIFTKGFYLRSEFYDVLKDKRPDLEGSKLSSNDLRTLGYRAYDDMIYSIEFNGPYSAFKKMINGKTNLDFTKEYMKNKTVQAVMSDAQKGFEWFRYSECSYIHKSKLEMIGVTERVIREYIQRIKRFYKDRCFTLKKLQRDGFKDLDILGFTDPIFYNSILVLEFKMREIDRVMMFNAMMVPKLGMILEQIVGDSEYLDMSDIQDSLESEYGIVEELQAIKLSINTTGLYYNSDPKSVSQLVYKDKDAMIRFALKHEDWEED